jgi:hypothetical protein
MLPVVLVDPAATRPALARCRYVLILGRATRQHAVTPDRLLQIVAPWSEPVLISTVPAAADHTPVLALALVKQRPADAH